MSSTIPGPSSPTHPRSPSTTHFRTFSASRPVSPSTHQLERCSAKAAVATAISLSGWLAIATIADVRLYVQEHGTGRINFRRVDKFARRSSHGKKICDLALSDDLLAVVTNSHLLVYVYRDPVGLGTPMQTQIDQGGRWRPKAVRVLQIGSMGGRAEAYAWIAVGGQGQNGVNIFKCIYSPYSNTWSLQGERVILPCPDNTGFVRLVGFSPSRLSREDRLMVLGVTEEGRLHCWTLHQSQNSTDLESQCSMDGGCGKVAVAGSNSGYIASASIFICPLGSPYVLCAVNHKPGSNLFPTFVVPIATSPFTFGEKRLLPQLNSGSVLGGTVTPNGHFIITIEGSEMVLWTLQTALDGGLTCLRDPVRWKCPLKAGPPESNTLTISVKETYGKLEILAVDGSGCVMSAQVNIENMPSPPLPRPAIVSETPEMSGVTAIFQLSSDGSAESSRHSTSSTTSGVRASMTQSHHPGQNSLQIYF